MAFLQLQQEAGFGESEPERKLERKEGDREAEPQTIELGLPGSETIAYLLARRLRDNRKKLEDLPLATENIPQELEPFLNSPSARVCALVLSLEGAQALRNLGKIGEITLERLEQFGQTALEILREREKNPHLKTTGAIATLDLDLLEFLPGWEEGEPLIVPDFVIKARIEEEIGFLRAVYGSERLPAEIITRDEANERKFRSLEGIAQEMDLSSLAAAPYRKLGKLLKGVSPLGFNLMNFPREEREEALKLMLAFLLKSQEKLTLLYYFGCGIEEEKIITSELMASHPPKRPEHGWTIAELAKLLNIPESRTSENIKRARSEIAHFLRTNQARLTELLFRETGLP